MGRIRHSDQITELRIWYSEIRNELLYGKYNNRGKMQRKLLNVEKAITNLNNARMQYVQEKKCNPRTRTLG